MRPSHLLLTLALGGFLAVACGGSAEKNEDASAGGISPGQPCPEVGAQVKATKDCGWCSCTPSGWACTEMPCSCSQGDSMPAGDGCNTCSCLEGDWICTQAGCTPTCVMGDLTSDGCNSCICLGWQWTCTENDCATPECPAASSASNGATCDGQIVFARSPETGDCCQYDTRCEAPVGWETFGTHEECLGVPTCLPGATMAEPDGCNTCTCADDGAWACTEELCTDEPQACGGRFGNTCPEDEYCAYEEGQLCGAADASATCEKRPEACDGDYDPVCGCDGQTYGNACQAATAGTGVRQAGECGS